MADKKPLILRCGSVKRHGASLVLRIAEGTGNSYDTLNFVVCQQIFSIFHIFFHGERTNTLSDSDLEKSPAEWRVIQPGKMFQASDH